jgi:aminopeptidase N
MKALTGLFFAVLLLLHMPSFAAVETIMPQNDLTVRFDLKKNRLTGVSKITMPAGQPVKVGLKGIKVKAVSLNDRPLKLEDTADSITFTPGSSEEILKIEYEAAYSPEARKEANSAPVYRNFITPEGVLLTANWYPAVEGLSNYRLSAVLPPEFEGISEAEEVRVTDHSDNTREFQFIFGHPLRELAFTAGKYHVSLESYGELDIYTYLLSDENGIGDRYMEAVRQYLGRYEPYLGKYPYRRLAVAETPFPGSYSFPGMIIFGRDSFRDMALSDTSLQAEIVRQWFGNMVYVDLEGGDWAEGLSAYLAAKGSNDRRGWEHRKKMLIFFQSYAEEKDFPLQSFRNKTDRTSAAIGRDKAAMVFHMLRKIVGEEGFNSSLRRFIETNSFRTASWKDLREAFEAGYGESLEWFFQQWLTVGGVPELEVKDTELKYGGEKIILKFYIDQKKNFFRFYLPVTVKLWSGEVKKVFLIEKFPRTLIEIEIDATETPVSLVVDENYDLFRKLSGEELPPVVSRLLGDDQKIYVIPEGKEDPSDELSGLLAEEGFVKKKEEEISYEEIRSSSLLIPDRDASIVRRLFGRIDLEDADFSLVVKENPFNDQRVISVLQSAPQADSSYYLRKIPGYGEYGKLSFAGDKITVKNNFEESERGIGKRLSEPVSGIAPSRVKDIHEIIDRIAGKDIVYVGESHDRFEDHRVQLQVIKEMYRRNKKIAIGMEMFEKSSQQALDDYISGKTDESTFLKESKYFSQWGFDYNLYREILLFARAYKIPVIALNIRKDIVSKISGEGLHSLKNDELKEVPQYFDISDTKYRERLRNIFKAHPHPGKRNFDFFYQAQVLWDESMARNLDGFIRENPEHKVVVLAGQGHLMYGSGIPRRAFRLNGRAFAVILNNTEVEDGIADFVLFPPTVPLPESPKLGVVLKEEEKKIVIARVGPGSIAEKAGLQVNDILLSADGTEIKTPEDLRIILLAKNKGEEITIRALRKSFFGTAEKIFKIVL